MIHKMGQGADKSLKRPILLEYFSEKSCYFCKGCNQMLTMEGQF